MDVLKKSAARLVNDYLTVKNNLSVICDAPHQPLAAEIRAQLAAKPISCGWFVVSDVEAAAKAFDSCRERGAKTLVLLEPPSFSAFAVGDRLDFSNGRPKIKGLHASSYVSILPIDSALRVYGSDKALDEQARTKLLAVLEANTNYRVESDLGTELHFTARQWLDHKNEILTAPLEESVNGVIAVDGAVFFQKSNAVLDFYVQAGELVRIRARDAEGTKLVRLYEQMTAHDFKERKNRQLAEIGIGCNTGAIISGCFMESEMVYGTCHFCFGYNVCYGGENASDFHGGSLLIKRPRFIECGVGES